MMAAGSRASRRGGKTLSPGSLTEAIVDCVPKRGDKLVLPPTETGYFQATHWIYSQERECILDPAAPQTIDLRAKAKGRTIPLPTKTPYLLNKEENEEDARKDMVNALRFRPGGFYYYKHRRLFKPRTYGQHLPTGRNLSPLSPSPRAPATPDFGKTKLASPLARRCFSPGRKRSLPEARPTFLSSLLEKCAQVRVSKVALEETQKELERERQVEQRLEWTKQTLGEVEDCGADVLIPFYRHQREAAEDFRHDVHRLCQIRRQSDSPKIALQLAHILRKNKNQLI